MDVLENTKKLLKEKGKSQVDLCKHLGVPKQTFTDWNRGKSKSYIKYVPQIAEYLGVSVTDLYGQPTFEPVEIIRGRTTRPRIAVKDSAERDMLRLYRKASPEVRAYIRGYLTRSAEDTPIVAGIKETGVADVVRTPVAAEVRIKTRGEARDKTQGEVRVRVRGGGRKK